MYKFNYDRSDFYKLIEKLGHECNPDEEEDAVKYCLENDLELYLQIKQRVECEIKNILLERKTKERDLEISRMKAGL
jgi:hypothetical protein